MLLTGLRGSGKTTILQQYADQSGMVFQSLDCLYHLNLTGLKTMIQNIDTSVPKLIEILNFDK